MKNLCSVVCIFRFALGFLVLGILPLVAAPFRMLPFQGRLTDASGVAIPDGARVVQFKIYDAPSGGTAVWNGEVHKLTVNGGLISTLLGSKAVFTSSVDFNEALYLEITVDADGDGKITAADPPLLPRQSILPSVFAVEAQVARSVEWVDGQGKAQGSANWSALFGPNVDPTMGKINASRLADGSLSNAQIRPGTITADRLVAGTVTASQLGTGAVGTPQIADEAVTSAKIRDGTISPSDVSPGFGLVPVGTVVAFAGSVAPPGWLSCDGSAVSRTTYAVLFGVIGNAHGIGDGTSTFNLPDYRGRFLRGVDGGALRDLDAASRTAMAVGGGTGNTVGSVQADELKSHTHDLIAMMQSSYVVWGGNSSLRPGNNAPVKTDATGGSETRPKNAYVYFIIKY